MIPEKIHSDIKSLMDSLQNLRNLTVQEEDEADLLYLALGEMDSYIAMQERTAVELERFI